MQSSNIKKQNLAISGKPLSQEEFISLIKEAENGPFCTHEQLVEKLKAWKQSLKD